MAKNRNGDTPDSAEQNAATTEPQPKPPAIPTRAMYLGPTFSMDGALYQHGQIFKNGIPVTWLERVSEVPEFRLLLVPIARVPKATADLRNPQSALSLAAKKVRDHALTKRAKKNG